MSTAPPDAGTSPHFRHSYTKDRRELLNRLRRIEGQARGLQRLVEGEAYCLDVLQQVEALTAAAVEGEAYCLDVLQQVEALTAAADQVGLLLLEDHISGCLSHAIETGQGQPYVDEVMAVVRRTMGRPRSRRKGSKSADAGS